MYIYIYNILKKVREKSRKCHNHKPQPFPDTKRKRKQTKPNKRKSNKRTKSTKVNSLFPKRGSRNAKRTEKHKNKITQGKTYNKSPRRINHKATKSKTNTGNEMTTTSYANSQCSVKPALRSPNKQTRSKQCCIVYIRHFLAIWAQLFKASLA